MQIRGAGSRMLFEHYVQKGSRDSKKVGKQCLKRCHMSELLQSGYDGYICVMKILARPNEYSQRDNVIP